MFTAVKDVFLAACMLPNLSNENLKNGMEIWISNIGVFLLGKTLGVLVSSASGTYRTIGLWAHHGVPDRDSQVCSLLFSRWCLPMQSPDLAAMQIRSRTDNSVDK